MYFFVFEQNRPLAQYLEFVIAMFRFCQVRLLALILGKAIEVIEAREVIEAIEAREVIEEFTFRKGFTPLLFAATRQRKIMMVF